MRRKDKEVVDEHLIQSVLQEAEICRLAMADGKIPYIVPLNFAAKDGFLYFHSAREGRKIEMLKQNNLVCFEAEIHAEVVPGEKPCNWSTRYLSVIGYGVATIVADPLEKCMALDLIMTKYAGPGDFVYSDEAVERICVIKVEITELTGKKSKM